MADAPESTGPILGPTDILGVVQRTAAELHAYCSQPPHVVDRAVCMAMLEHAASYLGFLAPLPAQPAHANDADSKRRAN